MQRWQQQQMTHERPIQSERPLADWLGSMNTMQKLGLLQVPIVSDVAGLLGDIQQYREQPESRNLLNYSMTGLGMLPMIPAMTVFHGSPHKWLPEEGFSMGRPRLDKIGTGEGAQAYGHGMYFAESPGVAKSYAEMAKDRFFIDNPKEVAGRLFDELEKTSIVPGKVTYGPIQTAYSKNDFVNGVTSGTINWWNLPQKARDAVEKSFAGKMYTLDLPDERIPNLLDWDKPLSQQSDKVRAAIRPAAEEAAYQLYRDDPMSLTGAEVYNTVAGRRSRSFGKNQPETSEWLQQLGIPGLRYLDAASRGAGNGTSNFVVWDQSLLDEMARRMADMASKK